MSKTNDIHDEREQNKMGLESYFLDKTNIFDISIDKLIGELKAETQKSEDKFYRLNKLQETGPNSYLELLDPPLSHSSVG
jgi:hypothetical protein